MSKKKNQTFHKEMTVSEAVDMFPEAADILMGYGLHCVGCYANAFETLEQGVMGHGYSKEEVKELVEDLNEAYEETKNENKIKKIPKEADDMAITISDLALKKIQSIAHDEEKDGYPLRVDVRKVGPEYKYTLNFIEPKETSKTDKGFSFANNKVRVVIDKRHYSSLNGLEIDYLEEEHRSGFKMHNPNI